MRILIEVTALHESGSRLGPSRYLGVLSCKTDSKSWECALHERDEHGPRLAGSFFAADPLGLIPAARRLLLRVVPSARLLFKASAEAVLKQRLAFDYARSNGWRADRCLNCMGTGRAPMAAKLVGETACVLCAGHGMRYWRPEGMSAGHSRLTYSADDLFPLALGGDDEDRGSEVPAFAG